MEKHILILSDFVGYGNVAMATSRAVLTKLGCTVLCLPTALISNTWNFGTCAVLDTTEYIRQSLEIWETLSFRLDAVLIGYVADATQAEFLARQCEAWREQGVQIFLDPIFADNGKLYRGITEERLTFLRNLLHQVDCVFPNATESCFLAQTQQPEEALERLAQMTKGSVVITGVDNSAVLLWDGEKSNRLDYTPVPGSYSGAGDAFTALCIGRLLTGTDLLTSVSDAVDTTKEWIRNSLDEHWQGMGLPVERYFY